MLPCREVINTRGSMVQAVSLNRRKRERGGGGGGRGERGEGRQKGGRGRENERERESPWDSFFILWWFTAWLTLTLMFADNYISSGFHSLMTPLNKQIQLAWTI